MWPTSKVWRSSGGAAPDSAAGEYFFREVPMLFVPRTSYRCNIGARRQFHFLSLMNWCYMELYTSGVFTIDLYRATAVEFQTSPPVLSMRHIPRPGGQSSTGYAFVSSCVCLPSPSMRWNEPIFPFPSSLSNYMYFVVHNRSGAFPLILYLHTAGSYYFQKQGTDRVLYEQLPCFGPL